MPLLWNPSWKTIPLDIQMWSFKTGGLWRQVPLHWNVGPSAGTMWSVNVKRLHCMHAVSYNTETPCPKEKVEYCDVHPLRLGINSHQNWNSRFYRYFLHESGWNGRICLNSCYGWRGGLVFGINTYSDKIRWECVPGAAPWWLFQAPFGLGSAVWVRCECKSAAGGQPRNCSDLLYSGLFRCESGLHLWLYMYSVRDGTLAPTPNQSPADHKLLGLRLFCDAGPWVDS